MCTKLHDREEGLNFGTKVFKIYFYTFYNTLQVFQLILHDMINLFWYIQKHWRQRKQAVLTRGWSAYWSFPRSHWFVFPWIHKTLRLLWILINVNCQWGALELFRNILTFIWEHVIRLPLTFAAILMYLIVYKTKHFVLYIVNLLHFLVLLYC